MGEDVRKGLVGLLEGSPAGQLGSGYIVDEKGDEVLGAGVGAGRGGGGNLSMRVVEYGDCT